MACHPGEAPGRRRRNLTASSWPPVPRGRCRSQGRVRAPLRPGEITAAVVLDCDLPGLSRSKLLAVGGFPGFGHPPMQACTAGGFSALVERVADDGMGEDARPARLPPGAPGRRLASSTASRAGSSWSSPQSGGDVESERTLESAGTESSRQVSSERRASRRTTMSRTVSGTPSSRSGRSVLQRPSGPLVDLALLDQVAQQAPRRRRGCRRVSSAHGPADFSSTSWSPRGGQKAAVPLEAGTLQPQAFGPRSPGARAPRASASGLAPLPPRRRENVPNEEEPVVGSEAGQVAEHGDGAAHEPSGDRRGSR